MNDSKGSIDLKWVNHIEKNRSMQEADFAIRDLGNQIIPLHTLSIETNAMKWIK